MGKPRKKVKVLISFGTRPEGIKLAPIIKQIEQKKSLFELMVCSTGQHREMLNQVLNFFEIEPHKVLDLMTENQTLSLLSSKILSEMDNIFTGFNPDIILVQGDTTTAFLAALSAYYRKIKVGHVEAGLRTYNKYSPYPEEINRQLISRIADFSFVPTEKSLRNLQHEGINKEDIFFTGNTIVDALEWSIKKIENNKIKEADCLASVDPNKKIILVTMHRRESFGEEINNVCLALKKIAEKYKGVQIIYPVHLNPNVHTPVHKMLSGINNIILCPPTDYQSFIWLMNKSYFIITDSGGVQEEAPTLKKPVIVIRNHTERMESVEMSISRLIGTQTAAIIDTVSELLDSQDCYQAMVPVKNPYGDGRASERIVNIIYEHFSKDSE